MWTQDVNEPSQFRACHIIIIYTKNIHHIHRIVYVEKGCWGKTSFFLFKQQNKNTSKFKRNIEEYFQSFLKIQLLNGWMLITQVKP